MRNAVSPQPLEGGGEQELSGTCSAVLTLGTCRGFTLMDANASTQGCSVDQRSDMLK